MLWRNGRWGHSVILYMAALTVGAIGVAFGFMFLRLASRLSTETAGAEWLESFSLDTYAPMAGLLNPHDFAFLEEQPGYRPAIGKRLRAERRKVFAGYLDLLVQDFNQLLRIGRLMQVSSSVDRPDLAGVLWRQQVRFYVSVCIIRCRLALSPLGLQVSGQALVESLGAFFKQVTDMGTLRGEVYGG